MAWRTRVLLACGFAVLFGCDELDMLLEEIGPLSASEGSILFTRFESDGTTVDPGSLRAKGTLGVTTRVAVNRTDHLTGPIKARLLLDGQLVHEETIPPMQLPTFEQTFTRAIDTDEIDPTTKRPTFLNGSHQLVAELVNEAGVVVNTTQATVVFDNSDRIEAAVVYNTIASAVDPDGTRWIRGGLTVNAATVLYNPGR
jgi:hypothetical protein